MKSLYDSLRVLDPNEPTDCPAPVDDFSKLTAKNFSKAIVESRQYRESIARRVVTDTLPPAVECRILDHALGKPIERVEVKDRSRVYDNVSPESLHARIAFLQKVLDRLPVTTRMNDAVPQSSSNDDEDVEPTSVH